MTIYNPNFVQISLHVTTRFSKVTLIFIGVLEINSSSGLSFPNCVILTLIPDRILVVSPSRIFNLIKNCFMNPGLDFHPSEPNYLFLRHLHCYWTVDVPGTKLGSLTIDFHDFSLGTFQWVVYRESYGIAFPDII